ncbi:LOW QUALITY PROTEIN: mediator of DNA damage checkpoint protein 1 [Pluvialis apricaria]
MNCLGALPLETLPHLELCWRATRRSQLCAQLCGSPKNAAIPLCQATAKMWPRPAWIQMLVDPKSAVLGPQTAPGPVVGGKTPTPNVQPPNHCLKPQKVADPDVKHLEGSSQALDIESETDVKVPPKTALFHPNHHRTALEVSSDPDVEERGPNPDVEGPKSRCQMVVVDSDTDVEEVEVPKIRRTPPNMPKTPGVEMETPNPDVGSPQNGCQTLVDSDTDVELESSNSVVEGPQNGHQMLVVDSDTDVEEGGVSPDVGCPRTHRATQNVSKSRNIAMETHGADVECSQKGHHILMVDSDTDVEEDGADPDVGYPETHHQTTQNIPKNQIIETEMQNAGVGGSKKGQDLLVVDSDTDVEEGTSNPDVESPESHRTAHREPAVRTETTNRNVGGRRTLLVESDTDVEEDSSSPESGTPKTHRATQNVPKNPRVVKESPHPCAEGPQKEHWTLVVDSDIDVEETGVNPDAGRKKIRRVTRKDQNVEVKNSNPDGEERRNEHWNLEVDSDTDVEDDNLRRGVLHPKSLKTPENTAKVPTVVMETPNPDVGGLSRGSVASNGDSDTDVEDLPDAGAPKPHGTTREVMDTVAKMAAAPDVDPKRPTRTNDDPDVKATFPTPDVGAPKAHSPVLNVDSDTDVEDNDDIPDVGTVQGCRGPPGDPDVAMRAPNPGVSPPARPQDSSDTDMEEVAPTPDVRGLRSHGRFQNRPHPDVVGTSVVGTASNTDMEETGPNRWNFSPKRPDFPSKREGDTDVAGMVPNHHNLAPNADVETPNPDVGTQRRTRGSPGTGRDPAALPDVSSPKPPHPAPNSAVAGDADGAAGSARATPGGDTAAVTESDPDTEEDPDLFLEPTQRFFLPEEEEEEEEEEEPPPEPPRDPPDASVPPRGRLGPQRGSPAEGTRGWDPEEPTQPFLPMEEEEEEEEQPPPEPPRDPPDASVPPQGCLGPQRGSPAEGTRGWDPEEPTQPFLPMEEEEWSPPRRPPPATGLPPAEPVTVTPAREGTGTGAAAGGEVGEGPRRSQRLASRRGGGATGGGASGGGVASRVRGGATREPAPVRRSLRLRPSPPPATRGRGQAEPRPPPKPRPRRGGHAPSRGHAQEKEEEPPEAAGPQLRPPGGAWLHPPQGALQRGGGFPRDVPSVSPWCPHISRCSSQGWWPPQGCPQHVLMVSSCLQVMFTGVVASPDMEVALKTLGGSMATSVFDCTHLVTDRVRRTVKFLCAVARGVPIVTPEWLHKSACSGRVLVPGPFLVRDSQQERHFGFSLAQALRRARSHPLLQGYEVHVTPNVRPEPEHMRDIITCSGGTFLPAMPHTYGPRRVVISCAADAGRWAPALSARLPLASAELLLTGLLRQRLQLQPFLLPPPAAAAAPPPPPNPRRGSYNPSGGPSSSPPPPPRRRRHRVPPGERGGDGGT